jgi:two-component system, NarL family, response regulator DevR
MPTRLPNARIVIIDPNTTTRDTLAQLLCFVPGVEVVGMSGSAYDALAQMPALQPTIMLLDLAVADGDGADAIALLVRQLPHVRVIALSAAGAAHVLTPALARVIGILLIKPITADTLSKAVRHARQGE